MTESKLLRACAVGLLVGPLLFTVGDVLRRLVDHAAGTSVVSLTSAVSERPGTWLAAGLLSALAPIFFLPGVAALVATARGRGATVTMVGGSLLGLGLLASVGHAVAFYSPAARLDRADVSDRVMRAIDRAYPLDTVMIVLFIAGLVVGTIVLLIGLRMAGRVPIWAVVAGVVFAVAGSSGGVALGVVGLVAALVAFAPAARSLSAERSLLPVH